MNFSSLIALEHRFLKFHYFLELESFTNCKFWKTGKNGWCPCILCWKAVGTLGTNCRWQCPHLRMSGITHSTHAVRYQVHVPLSRSVQKLKEQRVAYRGRQHFVLLASATLSACKLCHREKSYCVWAIKVVSQILIQTDK